MSFARRSSVVSRVLRNTAWVLLDYASLQVITAHLDR
jgi:hypothetical protein